MIPIHNFNKLKLDEVPIDPFWNLGEEKELKMHRIHAYPAKFPAFITTKALGYAKENGLVVKKMADIFCGCGTVAFEAKRNNIHFWGCDINPVATMIARTKSRKYNTARLRNYCDSILNYFVSLERPDGSYMVTNERLKYWHSKKQRENILCLRKAIEHVIPVNSIYREFFLCAFSNILKPSSRWLTKSIKPQVDPHKMQVKVITVFKKQCKFMIDAYEESDAIGGSETKIVTANFLDKIPDRPKVDMIVTSPPYVTSYEYADLHQLSSLWLGYTEDYRSLREGSIGSLYHDYNFKKELKRLNTIGGKVVFRLLNRDKSKAHSVGKYFLDMQRVTNSCYTMLSENGMALFVIGNTEYKGVKIENVKHLVESLSNSGFKNLLITKRKITRKILTPYRDPFGRFSSDHNSKKIYSEEFIITGRK